MPLEAGLKLTLFLGVILYLFVERHSLRCTLSVFLNCLGWRRPVIKKVPIYEPEAPLVFKNSQLPDLSEGTSITITGFLEPISERFLISLSASNRDNDMPLILYANLFCRYIIRSSRVRGCWGVEQIGSTQPFNLKRNSKFTIEILITEEDYMIALNGSHFAKYRHELSYDIIDCIEVKGDVRDVKVTFAKASTYPQRFKEMQVVASFEGKLSIASFESISHLDENELLLPFYGRLGEGSLVIGSYLRIDGYVKMLPTFFMISLQQGADVWPQPIVAFLFNPQYAENCECEKHVLVCRSWKGKQMYEDRFVLEKDLFPMKTFSLAIVPRANAYIVYLNKKSILRFRYRVDPYLVNTVAIEGDIKLKRVTLGLT